MRLRAIILSRPVRCIIAVVSIVVGTEVTAGTQLAQTPIVIGHRGASGYVPEHSPSSRDGLHRA